MGFNYNFMMNFNYEYFEYIFIYIYIILFYKCFIIDNIRISLILISKLYDLNI